IPFFLPSGGSVKPRAIHTGRSESAHCMMAADCAVLTGAQSSLYLMERTMEPGPIRHETLPQELLEEIRAVHDVLGDYLNMTLEEFTQGFQRDESPETEIGLWLGITAVWIAYHEEYLNDEVMAPHDERRLLSALIAISSGETDAAKLGVPT